MNSTRLKEGSSGSEHKRKETQPMSGHGQE